MEKREHAVTSAPWKRGQDMPAPPAPLGEGWAVVAMAARPGRLFWTWGRRVAVVETPDPLELRVAALLAPMAEGEEVTTRELAVMLDLPVEGEAYRAASVRLGAALRRAGWELGPRRAGAGVGGRGQRVYRRRPAEGVTCGEGVRG